MYDLFSEERFWDLGLISTEKLYKNICLQDHKMANGIVGDRGVLVNFPKVLTTTELALIPGNDFVITLFRCVVVRIALEQILIPVTAEVSFNNKNL